MHRLSNSVWHDGVQYAWTVDNRGALGIIAFDLKMETKYFPKIVAVNPSRATVVLGNSVELELPRSVWWMETALKAWCTVAKFNHVELL